MILCSRQPFYSEAKVRFQLLLYSEFWLYLLVVSASFTCTACLLALTLAFSQTTICVGHLAHLLLFSCWLVLVLYRGCVLQYGVTRVCIDRHRHTWSFRNLQCIKADVFIIFSFMQSNYSTLQDSETMVYADKKNADLSQSVL